MCKATLKENMHISVGIKEFLQVLLLFGEKVVWRASVMQELNVSGCGELHLVVPTFFIPWGAATKTSWWISCSEHKDAKEETQRDKWGKKKQSGDLFSKSDQIYFVSFVYLVSLSSLGFYKTQMLSSLNRLTSWKSDRAQIKILIIMIIIIIRDPTYLKNIL